MALTKLTSSIGHVLRRNTTMVGNIIMLPSVWLVQNTGNLWKNTYHWRKEWWSTFPTIMTTVDNESVQNSKRNTNCIIPDKKVSPSLPTSYQMIYSGKRNKFFTKKEGKSNIQEISQWSHWEYLKKKQWKGFHWVWKTTKMRY